MERIKRLFALVLCAAMIFSIIPMQGFASETETVDTAAQNQAAAEPAPTAVNDAVKVEHNGETTYYADLQKAFDGFAPNNNEYGGTYVVTLLGDVNGNLNKNLQYPTEVLNVTLDLNGHTITGDGSTIAVVINFGSKNSKDCAFTIKDSSGNNSGKITGGKGGVKVDGTNSFFYFQGGTITGNHNASKGGGILVSAKTKLIMTGGVITGNSVKGSSSANTGYGGGVLANYADITGGAIYGNVAYKGSHVQTGRGGGVCTEITRTTGYSTLNIAPGVVYGNTAENAGDDVMAQGNGNVKFTLTGIGTENWYVDGWNGKKAGSGGGETDRYNAENPVAYTDGGFTDVKNKTIGLKYVAPAEPEKPVAPEAPDWDNDFSASAYVFKWICVHDDMHNASANPFDGAFANASEVYEKDGEYFCDITWQVRAYVEYWQNRGGNPAHNTEVLPETKVYIAKWNAELEKWEYTGETELFYVTCKKATVAKLESTGEEFETLQEALDAAKTALEGDSDAEKIVLIDNTTECVKLSWLRSNGSMTLTIDLNGYTVTGDGTSSVMTFSGATSYNNNLHIIIDDSSEEKTGGVTGGYATSGGAIKMDNSKNGDSLTINGGNFYGNTATSSGGAIHCVTLAPITINGGNFYNNTAKSGGAISAYKVIVTGGTITGNTATGTDKFTGRGGGIALWGTYALELKVTGGLIYGNTATRYGDDIVFCSTNKTTASMALLNAADMGVEGVNTWCIDGYYGSFNGEALLSERYNAETNAVAFEEYASFGGKTAKGIAVALKAGNIAPVAPEAPTKFGENVTPDLIRVICDSDSDHAPINIKWQQQSTEVRDWVSGVVWSEEYNTWIVPIRIDSISTYYVWMNFEKEYNDIKHDLVPDAPLPEGMYHIDTYLKWNEEKQLWVTLDEKPIDVHVCCKTIPDAPKASAMGRRSFQIQVMGDLDGDGIYGENGLTNNGVWEMFATTIPTQYYENMVVYGSREEGFFIDVTVDLEDGDIFITNWIEKRVPGQAYTYDWDMTQKSITFTLKYDGSLTGTLYGDDAGDWVLASNGEIFGKVGEAFVCPAMPNAPKQENVVADLVTIICDSDAGRHAPVTGKWYPQHCNTTSDIVWNTELNTWTVDIRIGSLYIMYVDQLEDANNGTEHTLVEDITTVYSTLKWDAAQNLWVPIAPIELHTTCRTVPLAPVYKQLEGYQIKVYGDVNGEEKAWTTSLPENGYTLSEVYGSREDGFFVDVTVVLAEDDIYQQTWIDNRNPGFFYDYDWNKTPKTVTFTLKYNGSLTGTLHGDRHAVNTNYDWVLSANDKIFGVVGEAYLELAKFTLTLDPNGGKVDPATIDVTYSKPIGELPEATRSGYIFDGWVDEEGNQVTAETIYNVDGDSTITAQWIRHPGSSSQNVTKELFTIQCSVKHEHSWLCNWFGSHVKLVSGSVKWNEELGRWEAQCKIGSSMMGLINSSTTKKNYFGGITHHYDVTNYTFDLYYDPNFTGLNSQNKEVTGMWLPVQEYVVPVYCYTEPAMPNIAKITSRALWVRDTDPAFKNKTYSTTYTIKQLIAGTYTLSEMYTKDGKFYVDLTITDLTPYISALSAKNGKNYILPDWANHKSADEFKFTLTYTGSTTDYKQDGTGWSVDASSFANNKEKMNGMSLWLTEQFTVTYTDGVENKEIFADQTFTVNAYTENGGTKDDWADFSATATPTVEDPIRTGYTFSGWTPEVAATVTGDATYAAVWTINTYKITVETNKGGTVEVQSTADYNTLVKVAITPNAGYSVVSAKLVYQGKNSSVTANMMGQDRFIMPAADVTLIVEFAANEYTLTLDPNGGKVDPAALTVTFDAAIGTLPVPERTGYTFAGWVDAQGNAVTAETVYTIAGDSTVTAQWTANKYILTLDANGGKVDPAALTVTFDAAIGTLPVPERTGYTFAGWVDAQGNAVTAETVYTIAGDSTVTAQWTANKYILTLDANGGMFVMPLTEDAEVVTTLDITVVYDQPVGELPVPVRVGYTFAGWFDAEGNEITADTVYTIAGNSGAAAKWTANKYTVTLNPNYGKVDTKSVEVTYDEPIGKLPKPTREGFIFTFWRDEAGNMITEETIYNVDGDITLYAEWRTASPADSPATGDSMIMFVMASMIASAAALLFLIERKRRVQA